ncbi:MAG: hypothetical protein K2H47_03955 [Muribaculaceae bacterium]|nr:hypothetical protein [Muribaculaceae bacterium]
MQKSTTLILLAASMAFTANAAEFDEPIYETPEGESVLLSRSSLAYTAMLGDIVADLKDYGSIVEMITTPEGEVYLSNPISQYPLQTWIKGTVDGDKLTIKGPQPVYSEWNDDDELVYYYAVPMEFDQERGWFFPRPDMTMTFDIVDGGLKETVNTTLLGLCLEVESYDEDGKFTGLTYTWTGYGDYRIDMQRPTAVPQAAPEGLEIQSWAMSSELGNRFVNVAIGENEIYIQGIDADVPEAWVKGELSGDMLTIEPTFLGPNFSTLHFDYAIGGYVEEIWDDEYEEMSYSVDFVPEIVFTYNAEERSLFLENNIVFNHTDDLNVANFNIYLQTASIMYQNRNPEAAPATPIPYWLEDYGLGQVFEFDVPDTDVDGCMLDTNRLYYNIFVNGELLTLTTDIYWDHEEDMIDIPYNFESYDIFISGTWHSVYLYEEPINTLGVRSVYINENDEKVYSDIATIVTETSVNKVADTREVASRAYFDFQGRRIAEPEQGLYIVRTTYTDGTSSVAKTVRR